MCGCWWVRWFQAAVSGCLDDLPPPVEEFRAIQQQLRHEMGAKAPMLKDRIQHNQKSRSKAKGFGTKK